MSVYEYERRVRRQYARQAERLEAEANHQE
jgi:hypothetical protein